MEIRQGGRGLRGRRFTLTIGFAKKGLLADQAANFTGRLAVLPLSDSPRRDFPGMWIRLSSRVNRLRLFCPAGNLIRTKATTGAWHRCGFGGRHGRGGHERRGCVARRRGVDHTFCNGGDLSDPRFHVRAGDHGAAGGILSRSSLDTRLDVIAIGPGLGKEHIEDVVHIIEKSATDGRGCGCAQYYFGRHFIVFQVRRRASVDAASRGDGAPVRDEKSFTPRDCAETRSSPVTLC